MMSAACRQQTFCRTGRNELAARQRAGLAGHHITFTTAFERSYAHLSPGLQRALAALSILFFPFFAQGFAVVTGALPVDDEALSPIHQILDELARRSLLEVEGTFSDGSPATYRFQPALRQEAARRVEAAQTEEPAKGLRRLWGVAGQRGYGDIYSDLGLNRWCASPWTR